MEGDATAPFTVSQFFMLLGFGIFAIYSVIIVIKICVSKCFSAPLQDVEGYTSSKQRLRKILGECTECRFDRKNNKYQQTSCAICLAEFPENGVLRKLKCEHIFHADCIGVWIKAKINNVPKCPICNVELISERRPRMFEGENIEIQAAQAGRNESGMDDASIRRMGSD